MKKLLLPATLLCTALSSQAAVMIVATGPITYDTAQTSSQDDKFDEAIDGSGLVTTYSTGDAVPATLSEHHVGGNGGAISDIKSIAGRYVTNDPFTITLDLGGTYDLETVNFWNYAERWNGTYYNNRGVKDFQLEFSTDGGLTFGNNTGILTAAMADESGASSGQVTYAGETFDITDQAGVTHVKFIALNNHGGNYHGFSEINFTGEVVPEPSSAALLGLGGLALILRRRK